MPMHRIIAGTLYERHPTPYAYDLRVLDLGAGHVEAIAQPRYSWSERSALEPLAQADWDAYKPDFFGIPQDPPPPTPSELLDRAADNRERATRRARTKVRRLVKWKQLTTMLTLTYQENMTDRARMARDLDVFIKRIRRILPDWQYLAVFEKQKRGAWHAHLAIAPIKSHYLVRGMLVRSYDLLRSIWRGVIGAGGNVDVKRARAGRSISKLASYLAKYIGKSFGDLNAQKHENSYRCSGRDLPDVICERLLGATQLDAVRALIDLCQADIVYGGEFHQAMLDGGGYFLCLGPPPPALH
jgi:hypothetical protein